ncbi:MAG: hypothetical protein IT204_19640 [Fimbriimonadaceae bacterium]|nr:hypothetical protein [Fimbriimonadaceae bacterium]
MGNGKRWWMLLMVGLLGWSPADAKPVLQVWVDALKDNRPPAVVAIGGPIDAAWAVDPLTRVRLPPRLVEPGPTAGPQRGEIVHLVLYHQAEAQAWPESFLKTLSWDLRAVPADEVRVYCKALGKDSKKPPWQFVAVAPNLKWLQRAYELLLKAEAIDFDTGIALAFRIVPTLLVTGAAKPAEDWLQRQEDKRTCFDVRQVAPADLKVADLDGVKQLAVLLTWQEWHEKLSPEVRERLLPLLPEGLRQAAAGEPRDTSLVAEAQEAAAGRPRVAALLAPAPRLLTMALRAPGDRPSPAPEIWLDDFQTALRKVALVDLRRVQGVLVVPVAADAALQPLAEQAAQVVGRELVSGCQLSVVDDAVTSQGLAALLRAGDSSTLQAALAKRPLIDLLAVVRTFSLSRSTVYSEADPVCQNEDPGPYDVAEPRKPGPDDRIRPFGPRKYPQGENDPEYKKDLRAYYEELADWRRRRDERETLRKNSMVNWEQYLLETQTARLAGQLELYDRSGRQLRSWPLLATSSEVNRQVTRSTIRGFGIRPTSLKLPPSRPESPPALVQAAVEQLPRELPELLPRTCLLPDDPSLQLAAAAEPPLSGGRLLTVAGLGSVAEGLPSGRREARQDAIRQAVEQAVGVYLTAETEVADYQLKLDRIRTRARGFGRVRRVLQETADDQQVALQCEVEVLPAELRQVVVEEGLARQWRTMVRLQLADGERRSACPAAATALQRQVIAAHLPVIDAAQSQDLAARQAADLEAAVAGLTASTADRAAALRQARAIRTAYGAQVLLTGLATLHETPAEGTLQTAKASLTLQAINLYTAEVIASEAITAPGAEATVDLARQAALSAAGQLAGEAVVDQLLRTTGVPVLRLELAIAGLPSVSGAAQLQAALAELPTVQSLRRLEYLDGLAKWEVELQEAADKESLAVWLAQSRTLDGYELQVDRSNPSVLQARAVGVASATPDPAQEAALSQTVAAVGTAADEVALAAARLSEETTARQTPRPFEQPLLPAQRGNQTLVPLKPVVAWLGGQTTPDPVLRLLRVTWTAAEQQEHVLLLPSGKAQAQLDGGPWQTWPVAPAVLNGTLYVPLEALADVLQLAVERPLVDGRARLQLTRWDGERRYWIWSPPAAPVKAPPAKPAKPPAPKPRR